MNGEYRTPQARKFIKHVVLSPEENIGANFYLREDMRRVVWTYDEPWMERDILVSHQCVQIAMEMEQQLGLYKPVTIGAIPALPRKLTKQWERLFQEAQAVNDRFDLQEGDFVITKTQGIGKILLEEDGSGLKIHLCTGYPSNYELNKVNLDEIRKCKGKSNELADLFNHMETEASKYLKRSPSELGPFGLWEDGLEAVIEKYEFSGSFETSDGETVSPKEEAKFFWIYVKMKSAGKIAVCEPMWCDFYVSYAARKIHAVGPGSCREGYLGFRCDRVVEDYRGIAAEGWIYFEAPQSALADDLIVAFGGRRLTLPD